LNFYEVVKPSRKKNGVTSLQRLRKSGAVARLHRKEGVEKMQLRCGSRELLCEQVPAGIFFFVVWNILQAEAGRLASSAYRRLAAGLYCRLQRNN
jgi:hypothetical protein